MSDVQAYFQLTEELIKLLEKEHSLERDGKIAKIEELLDKRAGFMGRMTPPFSASDLKLGKQLVELEKKLAKLMEIEKESIKGDLLTLHKKQQSQTKYHNPYESLPTTDGVFYDKKN